MHLLFIEDDALDQRALVRALQQARLPDTYVITHNLANAQQALAAQRFDLAISDYQLGDGTALDLLDTHPTLPIIIITGAGDENIAVKALKMGAKDYVVKDVQGDYLKFLPKTIENVLHRIKLEAAEYEQRMFARLLHDSARIINSTLNLDEILKLILDNISAIIPNDAANIMLIEEGSARVVQYTGWHPEKVQMLLDVTFVVGQVAHLRQMMQLQHPCIINDTTVNEGWFSVSPGYEPLSYLAAPICVDGAVIGFLNLDSSVRDHFTPVHADRLQAFVDQVAVALKNARLYQDAHERAVLEERQRLARDLHDSVTQTLFAASVVSNAIIKRWQQQPASIGDDLLELRDLTIGALAEMRTLLFELRPNSLLETNLNDLLKQLVESIKGRARIQIDYASTGDATLPPAVHSAFFRLAQEALNNVVKHARARHLKMRLERDPVQVVMTISDDGRGFDRAAVTADHFGITIMHERAHEAGINLTITSELNSGTMIQAVWSQMRNEQ